MRFCDDAEWTRGISVQGSRIARSTSGVTRMMAAMVGIGPIPFMSHHVASYRARTARLRLSAVAPEKICKARKPPEDVAGVGVTFLT